MSRQMPRISRQRKRPMYPDDRAFLQETVDIFLGPTADQVCDVTLLTSDRETIPACRAMLAIRSPFFKKLFFSDFREKHCDEVAVGFSARVLRLVLEYAYSGRSKLTDRICATYEGNRDMPYVDIADLVDIAAAFDYCEMQPFRDSCLDLLVNLGPRYASTSCTALEAITSNHSPPLFDPVRTAFMKDVLVNPRASFKVPDSVISETSRRFTLGKVQQQYGILVLSEATLEEVLANEFPRQEQEYLFQCLYFWATEGQVLRSGSEQKEQANTEKNAAAEKRWNAGKRLANKLDFHGMRIMFLKDYVEPTGLLDTDTLCNILWHHSMRGAEAVRPQTA